MPSSHHGLLVIDKPPGLTSRAAVDRVQRWLPRGTRIGHTGTLDPLATGVLVICVGAATRLGEYVQRMQKVYRAGILLGARSDTDDADGVVTPVAAATPPDRASVEEVLHAFVGDIEQVPPVYSAAKVTGRRAYALARRGADVQLALRKVHIHDIRLLRYDYPHLELEVRCGKGTYVRSLARDVGQRLGCGGLIETLRRTRVGPFRVEEAVSLDVDAAHAPHLLAMHLAIAELPRVDLTPAQIAPLRHGEAIQLTAPGSAAGDVAAFDDHGNLVAILTVTDGQAHPAKVLIQ
jgi:tRNA pseudouridine55 synthase